MFNILVNCALFNSWFFSCTFLFSCYNYILFGGIAQLVRAHGSHPWGRGFKSPCLYQKRNDNLQRKIVVPFYSIHYTFWYFLFTESYCSRIYTLFNFTKIYRAYKLIKILICFYASFSDNCFIYNPLTILLIFHLQSNIYFLSYTNI